MAVRITHTNNSDGHDGTYAYRSTSPMDPQDLPAPIADEPPVALGAVFEYIDNVSADGTYYYRTQDHEGGQVSTVSDEVSVVIPPDYDSAQIGDEIGGGIYAGTITYADSREFHIVFAKQDGEAQGAQWGNKGTVTGANDIDDGMSNQNLILASFDNGDSDAFYHCRDYVDANGNSDYYLPARNELALVDALVSMSHEEFSTDLSTYRWTSTEDTQVSAADFSEIRRFSDGNTNINGKDLTSMHTRPIRRVPV